MTKDEAKQKLQEAESTANQKYNDAVKAEWALFEPHRKRWLTFVEPHFKVMMTGRGEAHTQYLKDMGEVQL